VCHNFPVFCNQLCCSALRVERSDCESQCPKEFDHKFCLLGSALAKTITDRQSHQHLHKVYCSLHVSVFVERLH
jgi:hypothetical protein